MKNKYEYIVNISRDFITLINRNYVYEIVNDAYCKVMEKKRGEILHKSVTEVWGEEKFNSSIKKYLDECFSGGEIHYIDKFKFGPFEKYMHVSYYPYFENNEITHALVFSHDITRISEIESKLTNYEYRDPVTGLFNRRSLDIILEKEIEKAKRSRTEKLRAVLFISLKNFAKVNQTYGHHVGDLLLENTGLRIKKTLRTSDFVFRFEGTDLTAILTDIDRNTDAAIVARNIYNAVSMPYRYKDKDIFISCFLGVSIYPDDGEDINTIIQNAASAMMDAKQRGEKFVLFNKALHVRALERMSLESELQRAFDNHQFELHYQPIVDRDGKICGAEALIRWHHPERGLVPPLDFIPLAEETGIINYIGKWTLYTACKQLKRWSSKYDIYISVNLCAKEFDDEHLIEVIESALQNAGGLDPKSLKLEITETTCMNDPPAAIEKMLRLEKIGIDLCIDDFGTGQSSLSNLKRLPVKTLKIDKVFVDDLVHSEEEREYLANIIRTVKSRKKVVLVEGVEDREQVELLRKMQCDMMQGFYYSKPVRAEEFEQYLQSGARLPL